MIQDGESELRRRKHAFTHALIEDTMGQTASHHVLLLCGFPYHDRLYRELGVREILLFKVAFARWFITQKKLKHTCSTDPNYLPGRAFTPRAISFIPTPVFSISKTWKNGDLERSSNIYQLLLIMHSQWNKFIIRNQIWGLWDQGKKREE